ncbi:hypothetical protein TRE132_39630 [Pseudomonas chlororaphis subsp. aurantiaca]|nr:hypothetical protein TRE132_39630 [Pseudomonas chlororaphis subsp. aurantiaca]
MTPPKRIALIGECMIELQHRADGSLQQSFGGDTLNTAVYLARELGEGACVDYVTALGDDSFSDAMCQSWAEEGIGLGMVQRLPGRLPGLYCIQTDAKGERRFLYWRNEAAVRDCFTTPRPSRSWRRCRPTMCCISAASPWRCWASRGARS